MPRRPTNRRLRGSFANPVASLCLQKSSRSSTIVAVSYSCLPPSRSIMLSCVSASRPTTARLGWTLTAVLLAVLLSASSAAAVTLNEVIALSRAGLADEVIVALIEQDPPETAVDAATVLWLKDAGVSEPVLAALVRLSGKAPEASYPEAGAAPVYESPGSMVDDRWSSLFWTPKPPAWADHAAPGFVPYAVVVVPGQGHGHGNPGAKPGRISPPVQGRFLSDGIDRFLSDGFDRFINNGAGPLVPPVRTRPPTRR